MNYLDQYKTACDAGELTTDIKTIANEADKASLLSLVPGASKSVEIAFLSSDSLALFEKFGKALWPVTVVGVLKGWVNQTSYVQRVTKVTQDMKTLVAVGGKLEHHERLYRATTGDKPWMIYRAIIYRAQVNAETRLIPLLVTTTRVEVK